MGCFGIRIAPEKGAINIGNWGAKTGCFQKKSAYYKTKPYWRDVTWETWGTKTSKEKEEESE